MKNRFDNDSPNKAFFQTPHLTSIPPHHLRCFNPHLEGINYIELKRDFSGIPLAEYRFYSKRPIFYSHTTEYTPIPLYIRPYHQLNFRLSLSLQLSSSIYTFPFPTPSHFPKRHATTGELLVALGAGVDAAADSFVASQIHTNQSST